MEVCVLVNEHREAFSAELGKSLMEDPEKGVTVVDAFKGFKKSAWAQEKENIAMVYPGEMNSPSSARHRAACAEQQCNEGGFDVVLSIHTTEYGADNDALYATNDGDTIITSNRALVLGGLLRLGAGRGRRPVIFADNHGIGWSVRNAVVVELGRRSKLKNIGLWRRELAWLASLDWERDAGLEFAMPNLTPYRRIAAVTYADRDELGLAEEYPAFTELPPNPRYVDKFGTGSKLHAVAWGLKYPPYSGQIVQPWPEALDRKIEWPQCCDYHEGLYLAGLRPRLARPLFGATRAVAPNSLQLK